MVGGGQGGIGLAARLKVLGVPTIVVDKNQRPGDSWRNRYPPFICVILCGRIRCHPFEFPDTGQYSCRKTEWETGWKCMLG
ncbi:MAG: hypothetical protein CM1200mP6_07240 [Anaerolineaceae bacterium]|nr:MAG: hypothetical protein CM1200mP6_07240 [Anaerolineaceae bacterium]